MGKLKLFLVGGFLGSGKTTAIQRAAKHLYGTKKKVGVITNDQGIQQVDTLFIRGHGIASAEVSGGCFCCNYNDLKKGIDFLKMKEKPDVIFAESVGSCADLAATVINPLLSFNPDQFEIVLSVFADVRLLVIFLQKNKDIFYDNVNYIYEKQLEEADLIVVNKIDLLTEEQLTVAKKMITNAFRGKVILYQNSLSEECIRQWLFISDGLHHSLLRSAPGIDYKLYGAGEAELAWLDEEVIIVTKDDAAVKAAYVLLNKIYDKLIASGHAVGHLKFLVDSGEEQWKISFSTIAEPSYSNDFEHLESKRATVLINARVQITPALLQRIVADAIQETKLSSKCKITEKSISAFKPGYPIPTYRIPAAAD